MRPQAYPEFCRSVSNKSSEAFRVAATEFEKKHGKVRAHPGGGETGAKVRSALLLCSPLDPRPYRHSSSSSLCAQIANSRWMLLLLWMVQGGTGLVPAKDIINAAKRMRIT